MKILNKIKIGYATFMLSSIIFFCSASVPILAKDLKELDPTGISTVTKTINDVAAKDANHTISYLSLFACIASLALNGYLIRRMMDDTKDSNRENIVVREKIIESLNELNKSISQQNENVAKEYKDHINKLEWQNANLMNKPCVFTNKEIVDIVKNSMIKHGSI